MSKILEELNEAAKKAVPFVKENMETDLWKLQEILRMKSEYSGALELIDKEKFFFVRSPKGFGFSEQMVNQLMTLAFKRGQEIGFSNGYDKGYQAARDHIREML